MKPYTMAEEDAETLRLIKLRHYQPMPHGVTEALCQKAGELIELQNELIIKLSDALIAIDAAQQSARNWRFIDKTPKSGV